MGGETSRRYLPLCIDLSGLRCLVVGGGQVGTRKAITLAEAGGRVTVLSPEITPELRRAVDGGRIRWERAAYAPGRIDGVRLVVAATPDPQLNIRIGLEAEENGALSCVVSAGWRSNLIFPAVYRNGGLTVAVHSNGRDPVGSCRARDRIASFLSGGGSP